MKFPPWSTIRSSSAGAAQFLDSGNLVSVKNESKRIVWQIFDYPTDTMLPVMKITLDGELVLIGS
jgi:hypothetical protein